VEKESGDTELAAISEKASERNFGSKLRVFLYLRQNPDAWHSIADIAKATDLEEEAVKSALKTVGHHPLVKNEEKDLEKVAYFRLLRNMDEIWHSREP